MNKAYSVLASAIIHQALHDYQKALEILEVAPDNRIAQEEKLDIEMFFESDWFQTLKELAPETLYDGILEDFRNDRKGISEPGVLPGQKDKSKRKTA